MKYTELEKYLLDNADKKFADFSKSLSNSEYISIGVKNPILRQLVKDHKNDEELILSDFKLGKYLEVDFIYFGLALSRCKNTDEQLGFLRKEIRKAKSWAITDCVVTYIKKINFEQYYSFFLDCYDSKYTYERREAYVLGLKLSKEKNILKVFDYIKEDEEYMVMMAEAWLLATIAINFENEVFDFLKNLKDEKLRRKTISKMSDSFRIKESSKEKFKTLR